AGVSAEASSAPLKGKRPVPARCNYKQQATDNAGQRQNDVNCRMPEAELRRKSWSRFYAEGRDSRGPDIRKRTDNQAAHKEKDGCGRGKKNKENAPGAANPAGCFLLCYRNGKKKAEQRSDCAADAPDPNSGGGVTEQRQRTGHQSHHDELASDEAGQLRRPILVFNNAVD